MVGRTREREAIAGALRDLSEQGGAVVEIEGEPGIGKSRLVAHLAATAAADGATVLGARASEFESDLPYVLWTEALDGHLAELGQRRVSQLGLAEPLELGPLLPALADAAAGAASGDRHRTHRALRDLLERLAAVRPLIVWLDDVHWADPASLDALAALVSRPPAAPVLFAVAAREGQLPDRLGLALAGAQREDRVLSLKLAPLSEMEAAELVGDAAAAIYPQTGGNPFYLEQLARVSATPRLAADAADESVPPAVAAALGAELSALTPDARRVLDAAAVAGDPFEPGLAAAVAEMDERTALQALDELLVRALVRPAGRHAGSRFATRWCATPSTRYRRPGGGSVRTLARPRSSSAAARARSSAPTTSSTPAASATRRPSPCSAPQPRSCNRRRRGPRRGAMPPRCDCCLTTRLSEAAAAACSGCWPTRRPLPAIEGGPPDARRRAPGRRGRRPARADGRARQPGVVARRA